MASKIIHPTYVTKLPSTGTKVSYRPFTVREEKTLLLALQEDSLETVIQTIKNTVRVCTDSKVDPDNIPYYDTEYLFLQIRAKSIGEIIDMVGSCDCSPTAKTKFTINIDDVKLIPEVPKSSGMRVLDTEYTITLRHPSIEDFSHTFDISTDDSIKTVASCITNVYTDDEVCNWTLQEKIDFVQDMTPKQQKPIAEFMRGMPMVHLPIDYVCEKCSKKHTSTLRGFQSFFL